MASDTSSDSGIHKPSQTPKPSEVTRAALAMSRVCGWCPIVQRLPDCGLDHLLTKGQLPRELVDQILDNLTVFKVLQLTTCQHESLDRAIIEHDGYKHLFKSGQEL